MQTEAMTVSDHREEISKLEREDELLRGQMETIMRNLRANRFNIKLHRNAILKIEGDALNEKIC